MSNQLAEAGLGVLADFGFQPDPTLEVPADDDTDLPDLLPATDPDDGDPNPVADDETDLELPDDPDALKGEVVKLRRQARHERELRVATGRKLWEKEAAEHYPYSRPAQITADSRSDFLKQAKQRDQEVREVITPLLAARDAREEEIRTDAEAAAQARVEAAWGLPTVGSRPTVADGSEAAKKLGRARDKRDLKGAVGALMEGGLLNG